MYWTNFVAVGSYLNLMNPQQAHVQPLIREVTIQTPKGAEKNQMTKPRGTRNYNEVEERQLLAVVDDQLPVDKAGWDRVATAYNASTGGTRKPRGAGSLRRKFTTLYNAARKTKDGQPRLEEEMALQLRRKIVELARTARPPHPAGTSSMEFTTPAASQPMPQEAETSSTSENEVESLRQAQGTCSGHDTCGEQGSDPREEACPYVRFLDATRSLQHAHAQCSSIPLLLWIEQRDERRLVRLRENHEQSQRAKRQQRELDTVNAERRHKELLECIASLKLSLSRA